MLGLAEKVNSRAFVAMHGKDAREVRRGPRGITGMQELRIQCEVLP